MEPLHEYAFDVKLWAAVRVKARTMEEARQIMSDNLQTLSCNGGAWPNGDPILFEASQESPDTDTCFEVDGEETF